MTVGLREGDKASATRAGGSSLARGSAALLLAGVLSACTGMPVQDVSDARQAISAAKAAGGDRYTPESIEEAERLVDEAANHLATGDYTAAQASAQHAKQQAIVAREAALSVRATREN